MNQTRDTCKQIEDFDQRTTFEMRKVGSCKGQILEMRDMHMDFFEMRTKLFKNESGDPTFYFKIGLWGAREIFWLNLKKFSGWDFHPIKNYHF